MRAVYITGGTLPPRAASYVTRHANTELLDALLAGEYCYVLNSRQMGKSSLCVRTMGRLRQAGVRTVFVDRHLYRKRKANCNGQLQWNGPHLVLRSRQF